jgi:sigma-B regulation protein RsbU (phosphoserine phosphatase)
MWKSMTDSSPSCVLEAVLERLEGSFRLDHEIGGRSLRTLLAATVHELDGTDLPRWGSEGPRRELVRVADGALTFAYRPHLFPGMSPDLELGHQVQFHLLPRSLPATAPVEVAAVLESYCHLSGDLFGWREESDGRFTIWVLDVSGHGLRAGFAAVVMKLMIAESPLGLSLPELLVSLERRFQAVRNPDDRRCLYATGLFVRLDREGGVEYASAGHPPMFIRRASGLVERCGATGTPIALLPGPPPARRSLHLAPDDLMLLYTDGLVEVRTRDGAPLGLDTLEARLRELNGAPHDVAQRLVAELDTSADLERLDDDVSFLVLRRRRFS